MKAFFANLNLARVIILGSLLACGALGWFSWKQSKKLGALKRHLQQDVPLLVNDIQRLAVQHTELTREMNSDRFRGQGDPISYINSIMAQDNIELGRMNISPSKTVPDRGITDHHYRVTPSDKTRGYDKARIANGLYKLEESSRRVRVTSFKVETIQRRLADSEIPDDRWTFDLTITSRQEDATQTP